MIDTTGLDGWMEPAPISESATDIKDAGTTYAEYAIAAAHQWVGLALAYSRGVGRNDLIYALQAPQLHASGVRILTTLCGEELESLADDIIDIRAGIPAVMAKVKDLQQRISTVKQDLGADYVHYEEMHLREADQLQREIDLIVHAYRARVDESAARIKGFTRTSPEFQKIAADDSFLDGLTGPWGAAFTPGISFALKFLNTEDGTWVNKDGDKWKLGAGAPQWLKDYAKSDWGKWIVKYTTPLSWGLGYVDQADDSAVQVVMAHPDWSTNQVAIRVLEETFVKGTVRNASGTIVSELASRGAAAATGALIGTSGGPWGMALGAGIGFLAGGAASGAVRSSGATGWIADRVQDILDSGKDDITPYETEVAPDTYPYPAERQKVTIDTRAVCPAPPPPPTTAPGSPSDVPSPQPHPSPSPTPPSGGSTPAPPPAPPLPSEPLPSPLPQPTPDSGANRTLGLPQSPGEQPQPAPGLPRGSAGEPQPSPGLPLGTGDLPSQDAEPPYVVKDGDSLDKIARDYGTEWPRVYEANKHIIGSPDVIYPGQKLTIPTG